MLCIVLMCQLYHVDLLLLFIYFVCCSTFPFIFCSTFVSLNSLAFPCSFFNSDPGLYSWYLDPVVREVPVQVLSSSMQVNEHNTLDCTDFVLQVVIAVEGETSRTSVSYICEFAPTIGISETHQILPLTPMPALAARRLRIHFLIPKPSSPVCNRVPKLEQEEQWYSTQSRKRWKRLSE